MHQIQLHRQWTPGGWCNFTNLMCSNYCEHFAPFLLNSPSRILRGIDAIEQPTELYRDFGLDDELFVRPNTVEKLFPGAVVHADNFTRAISSTRFDPTSEILVAPPRDVQREWRTVIAGDELAAASQYRDSGARSIQRGCPSSVRQFCDRVLRAIQWRPDPMFVMDICESNGEFYVLELNAFSCSGLYDCDLTAVVHAASEMATRNANAENA